ncbi:kinase-like domain-containing protein [Lentinula detonsa]|uniref:Kinase-like domain-containing protein n=1 Tax=Lentinula detonsa TaxID=2804962 RepID=A0A9W8TST3_9AGAR|nr:kinase-like domain-containing protein [Lentinula detonsa]
MAFVRAHTSIPVPRLYEVLLDSCGRHYIVMEYIDACELTITWSSLSEDQQKGIISELGRYWNELRQIPATGPAVCAVDGGTVKDHQGREFGPFPSFQDFATLYGYFILRGKCDSSTEQILENFLAKEHRIVFTHCDLAPRNILVKDGRIASIIDWECAGWFPEYWEANQVEYSNGLEIPDFGDKFIKSILPGFENEQRLEYELSRHIFRG